MTVDNARPSMTAQEIRAGIEDLARNGDGADRRWALRTLAAEQNDDGGLDPPLSDGDVANRLTRLMRGCGVRIARVAYMRAFPKRQTVDQTVKSLLGEDVKIDLPRIQWPRTVKRLYALCPELKQNGFPKSYPLKGTMLMRQQWVQKTFVEYHATKQAANQRTALIELESDLENGTDARTELPNPHTGAGPNQGSS